MAHTLRLIATPTFSRGNGSANITIHIIPEEKFKK
jgi:hypothetical protein